MQMPTEEIAKVGALDLTPYSKHTETEHGPEDKTHDQRGKRAI